MALLVIPMWELLPTSDSFAAMPFVSRAIDTITYSV